MRPVVSANEQRLAGLDNGHARSNQPHRSPIPRELVVRGQQYQRLAQTLRDEQAVERIFVIVEERELRDGMRVKRRDSQAIKPRVINAF